MAERGRPYYGWLMVGGLSLTELVSWGVLVYAFSVFLVPMSADLGWSVAGMNAAYATGIVVSGLAAVPVGRLLEAHGARGVMTAGSALTVLTLLWWSQVDSMVAFFAVFVVGGVAMATTLYEPAFAVTTTWFDRHRPRAVLVVTVVGGLASVVFIPLTGALVESLGWRDALLTLAAIAAAVGLPVHGLLLRRRPESLGLRPDGGRGAARRTPEPDPESRRAILRSTSFRWITLCLMLATMAKFAVGVIVVVYLTERGFPMYQATLAAGGVGLFQALGRVLVTVLRGRLPEYVVLSLVFLAQAAGMLAPLLTSGHGAAATASVVVFVVLFGLGYGLSGLMRGTLVADYYGPANFPSVNGVIAVFVIAGQAVGPVLAGLVGAFAGYEPVLVTAAVLAAASVPALVRAHRTRPR